MPRSLLPAKSTASEHQPDDGGYFGVQELVPLQLVAQSDAPVRGRINLVVPGILGEMALFGGLATALRLFRALSPAFECARIVATHRAESQLQPTDWPGWVIDDAGFAQRSITFLGTPTASLPISAADYFVATAWFTAIYVKQVIARQTQLFGICDRRFVYLIQDYEPAFYPWSARYAYALSTYSYPDSTIAVFNSKLLADYFQKQGTLFREQHVFEAMLDPRLHASRTTIGERKKERMILVYGRPSIARNDFDFVVEILREWARTFPGASDWTVISVGEQHTDISLGNGAVLQSKGKLTLEEYAQYLSRCWVGLSLMFSPHPSYPPLEMAEFGSWVITNTFENKDLSSAADNIISADDLLVESISAKVAWCCLQYQPGKTRALDARGPVFRGSSDEFPFTQALVKSWRGAAPETRLST